MKNIDLNSNEVYIIIPNRNNIVNNRSISDSENRNSRTDKA